MIRTDRSYNKEMEERRKMRISELEKELDDLANGMFDDPRLCTESNIRRLNYLTSQILIMEGETVCSVNCNDY